MSKNYSVSFLLTALVSTPLWGMQKEVALLLKAETKTVDAKTAASAKALPALTEIQTKKLHEVCDALDNPVTSWEQCKVSMEQAIETYGLHPDMFVCPTCYALQKAVKQSDETAIEYLLFHGANPNGPVGKKSTLFDAETVEVATMLLGAGAKVDVSHNNVSLLQDLIGTHWSLKDIPGLAALYKQYGANFAALDNQGQSLLFGLRFTTDHQIVRKVALLIMQGVLLTARPTSGDYKGKTFFEMLDVVFSNATGQAAIDYVTIGALSVKAQKNRDEALRKQMQQQLPADMFKLLTNSR